MLKKYLACCVLTLLLSVSHSPRAGANTNGALAVVVGKHCPINDLPFAALKRLYSGDRIDTHGLHLIPLALQNRSAERADFDTWVLGMTPDAAARYWVDRKIRGESGPPKSIDSVQVMLRVVDKLDGAVGYLRAAEVPAAVKILSIDGKKPTDPGYRLSR